MRDYLLPKEHQDSKTFKRSESQGELSLLDEIERDFPPVACTAAYIIMSDGEKGIVFEKDRITSKTRTSSTFVCATNHDVDDEKRHQSPSNGASNGWEGARGVAKVSLDFDDSLLEESIDRKECVEEAWERALSKQKQRVQHGRNAELVAVMEKDVIDLVQVWPVSNECTHYAAVLDPRHGSVIWSRRWLDPVQPP